MHEHDDTTHCPMCDFPNDPEAIRCRACGWVLVTDLSAAMDRVAFTVFGASLMENSHAESMRRSACEWRRQARRLQRRAALFDKAAAQLDADMRARAA